MASACPAGVWGSVPMLRSRPDGKRSRQRKEHSKGIRGRGSERGGSGPLRGRRHGCAREVMGKGKYRAETTPLPLLEQRPAERSNRGKSNQKLDPEDRGGRGVIFQATIRPRRTSTSRRSMGTRFTPTLTLTLMAESGMTICGKGGGVTSQSCPHGAKTRQAGRSGDALWWH